MMYNELLNRYPTINKFFNKEKRFNKNKSSNIIIKYNIKDLRIDYSTNKSNLKENSKFNNSCINYKNKNKLYAIINKPKAIINNSLKLNHLKDLKKTEKKNYLKNANDKLIKNWSFNNFKYNNYYLIKNKKPINNGNKKIVKKKKFINFFNKNRKNKLENVINNEYKKILEIYKTNNKIYNNFKFN